MSFIHNFYIYSIDAFFSVMDTGSNEIKLTNIKKQLLTKLISQMDFPSELVENYATKYVGGCTYNTQLDESLSKCATTSKIQRHGTGKNSSERFTKTHVRPQRGLKVLSDTNNLRSNHDNTIYTSGKKCNTKSSGLVKPKRQSDQPKTGSIGRPKSAHGILNYINACM